MHDARLLPSSTAAPRAAGAADSTASREGIARHRQAHGANALRYRMRPARPDTPCVRESTNATRYGLRPRSAGFPLSPASVTLSTWLTRPEQARVTAMRGEHLTIRHRETLPLVHDDLATGRATVALVSSDRMLPSDSRAVAALVRGFPALRIVALVSEPVEADALRAVLRLGRLGVRAVADIRTSSAWSTFRQELLADRPGDTFLRRALTAVLLDLRDDHDNHPEIPEGCVRFFAELLSTRYPSAKVLASALGVHPSTMASRFHRAALPSPRRFVGLAQMALVAHLAEQPGVTGSAIAHRIGASSPQSLARTVRILTGLTLRQFRTTYDGDGMLARFREELVLPYRATLRTFDPTGERPTNRETRETAREGAGWAA